jgi:predicted ATP-grasp superfamily ATP-dependent carboligase
VRVAGWSSPPTRRDDFTGVAVGTPPLDVVRRSTDKAEVAPLAEGAGLKLPPTAEVDRRDAAAAAAELGYPVMVKPIQSELAAQQMLVHADAHHAPDGASLAAALDSLPRDRVLVQKYLEGRLAAVCGVAWNGELVCASHQMAMRIWPPRAGVSAFAKTVPRDEEIEHGVARLVRALQLSGIFQTQFMQTRDGSFFIDLNPRMYGSLALAIAAGLDLPSIWLELLTGGTPRPGEYRLGVNYRWIEHDVRAVARGMWHGPRHDALIGLLPRRRTTHPIFRLDDPRPGITTVERLLRRARARARSVAAASRRIQEGTLKGW